MYPFVMVLLRGGLNLRYIGPAYSTPVVRNGLEIVLVFMAAHPLVVVLLVP